ncbi:MAG: hypothetical protein HN919_21150 [Verrucomicrobia bacterium]|jgi:hypothetical protein|nr:hypothetical protein [Verrucomicrobiota bacterium]MBT7702108.1 hypothetical protein [Verrucomicrobiota bacterium]
MAHSSIENPRKSLKRPKEEPLHSEAFKDLAITLEPIFDFPLEPGEEIRVVRESPAAFTIGK